MCAAVGPEGASGEVSRAIKNVVSYSLMYYHVICLVAHIVTLSDMVSIRMALAKINIYFLKKL